MPAASYARTRRLFLALLGAIYCIAFASLAVQVAGLVGDEGILPAGDHLAFVRRRLGAAATWRLPTVCWWLGADAASLQALCVAGVAAGALLAVGIAQGFAALAAWALYLSLAAAGQVFLDFQWDALLLEAGLLALPVASWRLRARRPSRFAPLLPLWLLVFKLHVLSGWVKLASGDPTWRDLSALEYHYFTTCLPVWVGWYAAQLPTVVHRAAVLGMYAVELLAPFAILGPRRLRHAAAWSMIALQVGIAATGNYGFFNLLTIALCLTLLDDAALGAGRAAASGEPPRRSPSAAIVATILSALVLLPMAARLVAPGRLPRPARAVLQQLAALRSFNGYGLFANMTTERSEIVIEGSDDGRNWREYEFRWKPGDPERRPAFVQPHMPRLDWQMWFAALQGPRHAWWFRPFLERLLAGTPAVVGLLERAPFGERPPRHVRALLYRYEFATPAERAAGAWWHRELLGVFVPTMSVRPSGALAY